MASGFSEVKRAAGSVKNRVAARLHLRDCSIKFPTYSKDVAQRIYKYGDEVRYGTIALALQRLEIEQIPGAIAEVGVYRGVTSAFIHRQVPQRLLYLFDTFEGFPQEDLEVPTDLRFKDTSQEEVAKFVGGNSNVVFRKGYFPSTSEGLEGEQFAFVMLDVDLYRPALEVFEFFYPRLVRGGYFFMHDFNNPESDYAISRAAAHFMEDKSESLIEIPDEWGTAVFRKN